MRPFSLAFALLLAAGPAAAAISVLGGGQAEECYHAARDGKADNAAVAACDMALNAEMLAPRDRGGTLINRGVVRLLRGEYAPARADFDAGIDMAPEIGEGWTDRGAAFLGERRYREALALLLEGHLYDHFHAHGPAIQWLLATIPITLIAILFLPEPAGKTLEEMSGA